MTPMQSALLHRAADAAPGLLRVHGAPAKGVAQRLAKQRLCIPVGDGWRITADGEAAIGRRRLYRVAWPDGVWVVLSIDNAAAVAMATSPLGTISLESSPA